MPFDSINVSFSAVSFHSYTAGYKITDYDTKPPLYLYISWLVNSLENTSTKFSGKLITNRETR